MTDESSSVLHTPWNYNLLTDRREIGGVSLTDGRIQLLCSPQKWNSLQSSFLSLTGRREIDRVWRTEESNSAFSTNRTQTNTTRAKYNNSIRHRSKLSFFVFYTMSRQQIAGSYGVAGRADREQKLIFSHPDIFFRFELLFTSFGFSGPGPPQSVGLRVMSLFLNVFANSI